MTREEFKGLFDKYFDSIRSYIYYRCSDTELATDIAQEVFMQVWEKQFEIRNGKIKSLIYKMAGDLFISRYRRMELEQRYMNSIELDYLGDSPEEQAELDELTAKYESSLAALPENQRSVFLMSRNEGLKYSEIAERLNISVKAVEKRMNKALTFLRDALEYKG
ncbi:MAG TPA: RNA polymerase sigma-70 factor [Bacteroidetes bacterium]|nr:RNA polymerase sigma-70 factor [Bacteroidota bacterium]